VLPSTISVLGEILKVGKKCGAVVGAVVGQGNRGARECRGMLRGGVGVVAGELVGWGCARCG
jgi:hypothetical protein